MVVTSPPYWGLRKYAGLPDLIWGGDGRCEHKWDKTIISGNKSNWDTFEQYRTDGGAGKRAIGMETTQGNFCSLCDAWKGQLGLEPTPEMYILHLVGIFREVKRVLRKDGICFINCGDSYFGGGNNRGNNSPISDKQASNAGAVGQTAEHQKNIGKHSILKPKDLCLIPFRLAIALQEDGWWCRSVIIWNKPNPMPESVTDRPSESHEYILMLTKSSHYYYDQEAVREKYAEVTLNDPRVGKDISRGGIKDYESAGVENPNDVRARIFNNLGTGRNLRSVWTFPTQGFSDWGYDYSQADYVGENGIPYKLSEDCPIHWRHPEKGIQRRNAYDEQLNPQSLDISDISNHPVEEPVSEFASIHSPGGVKQVVANEDEQIPESTSAHKTSSLEKVEPQRFDHIEGTQKIPASNSDYENQEYAPTAIEHSKQNHKRGPVLATNSPYSASVKSASRTDDKPVQPLMAGLVDRTAESNTLADGLSNEKGLYPSAQTLSRNAHKSHSNYTCNCRISQMSHFATYPEKLVEICVKAATPEVGCCSQCGKPWVRILEKTGSNYEERKAQGVGGPYNLNPELMREATKLGNLGSETKTLGWKPTCKCQCADKVPSLVLDPFVGSGTTLKVAAELNRRAIGYELSEEYCKLAVKRNKQSIMGL